MLNGCRLFWHDPAKDLLDWLSYVPHSDERIRSDVVDVFVVAWKYWALFQIGQISLSKWHVKLSFGKYLSGINQIIIGYY